MKIQSVSIGAECDDETVFGGDCSSVPPMETAMSLSLDVPSNCGLPGADPSVSGNSVLVITILSVR